MKHRSISRPLKGQARYVNDALCLTGEANANLVTNPDLVDCPKCKKLQKKLRLNKNAPKKLLLKEIHPHI